MNELQATSLFRLDDKTAIVTGAGSGIGRAIALLYAAAGAGVVAADLDSTAAEETVARIVRGGGRAHAVTVDVAAPEGIEGAVTAAVETFGALDVLVNNAGIYPLGERLPGIDWETYERTYAVNVFGALRCISASAGRMRPGGAIINISSMESLSLSGPGNAHYSSAKAALNGLTRAAAVDLGPQGIRVNAILPGLVKTEGTSGAPQPLFDNIAAKAPSGRVGEPLDIAGAALFLACPAASYVNGHCLLVDGGITISR
ncbi:SDR family NAD(P)-dependent oxidoreductase [Novosphingobium malaysiense]|uniref:Ketoreductase domain-containing protein n=1 Tax=Novosphingobium malaysiense TaxID=1348853 RepID=A0A0B1ZVH2_9SPHN|nr:glucose 1-dehydrogenase [Novosphingobium malaysiense]KHK93168.1 hypothetical protein LK12_02185 [Novosphingobium malaysiense]